MIRYGSPRFDDRRQAGTQLAERLRHLTGRSNVVILALPRGGVPVAFEVARALRQPLDLFIVRKLGLPGHEEFAMGAVASGGVRWMNPEVLAAHEVPRHHVDAVTRRETAELARREAVYRRGRPPADLAGKILVLVDDGIATGATMFSAIAALRQLHPARVIVAAPVIAAATRDALQSVADEVECVESPAEFLAVGVWYRDFAQVTDEEVISLLDQADPHASGPATTRTSSPDARTVQIPLRSGELTGELDLPRGPAVGLVVFAHGSGSSRLSPRNREVAAALRAHGFATLLFDLLTPREDVIDRTTAELRFDIPFLAKRLVDVTDWLGTVEAVDALPIGYFGASTGAAAALSAAADRGSVIYAVVSRGGRPDLAGPSLAAVTAPTLLIVGGDDRDVLQLNRTARERMRAAHAELAIVPGAGHLFEEPDSMAKVTQLASDWFTEHLTPHAAALPARSR
ncbi:MAG: phosphoribosyltransferase family protein [Gemmatimonadaceae bacterium]